MRASENKDICIRCLSRECLGQIDSGDLFGYRMFDPSLFDQGDEQRASFFPRSNLAQFEGAKIGMAADGGFSSDDHYFMIFAGGCCGVCSGLDDPNDVDVRRSFDFVQRESGCSIARDDQQVRALLL